MVSLKILQAAASGVGGAKLDNVCGFIENNGEVEAKVDDNEGKLGNHDDEEEDDDKNARLLPLPLSSQSLTPIDRTMGEVVGKTIVAVVVVLATTTHNGDDSDDNDEDGAEVMFAPDNVTAAVIVLDVYIGMMPPQCCCIDCSIVVVLGLLLLLLLLLFLLLQFMQGLTNHSLQSFTKLQSNFHFLLEFLGYSRIHEMTF